MSNYRKCLHCGESIHWQSRSDKKFCDAKCRKAYSRGKKKAERQIDDIQYEVNRLYLTLKRVEQSRTPEAMQKLKRLQSDVKQLLTMYDRATMIEQSQLNELKSRNPRNW